MITTERSEVKFFVVCTIYTTWEVGNAAPRAFSTIAALLVSRFVLFCLSLRLKTLSCLVKLLCRSLRLLLNPIRELTEFRRRKFVLVVAEETYPYLVRYLPHW